MYTNFLENSFSQYIVEHHMNYQFPNQASQILNMRPLNITLLQKTNFVNSINRSKYIFGK